MKNITWPWQWKKRALEAEAAIKLEWEDRGRLHRLIEKHEEIHRDDVNQIISLKEQVRRMSER